MMGERVLIVGGGCEERENRFNASKMAIITIMRSWPGERQLGSV